ncbi:hypothetical protein RPC_4390 [Rhodopseudomonas palustris BisB18]|uniref:Uncharacterized protein n=2 Tax=Rhodopseudomonas palustris TaxID=1076 RepID=Q20Y73_RHOPB
MGNRIDAQIDDIIASCDGNLVGAIKALILVNERLESEIARLQAAAPVANCADESPLQPQAPLTPSSETRCAAPAL